MDKGVNPHVSRRIWHDDMNKKFSEWSDRQFLHPGKEDPNIESRHLAESMVDHIDDKSLRDCDKEGEQCCQFYECPPLGIE
uniref:Uncharacterized protein n=1 Tax=Acrobeloides nanus TaxID=290746 RepID=A0A914CA73_9BILA